MKKEALKRLCVCAVLVALSTVLSMVKIWHMPLGGSVTLLSMLPVCLISIVYGTKTGLVSSFVYALIQLGGGLPSAMGWGMTPVMWAGSIIFDYLLAFSVLGLSGTFRKFGSGGIVGGVAMVCAMRFLSHLISGAVFFGAWMPEEFTDPFLYSFVYNGMFMLPELILTTVSALFVYRPVLKVIRKMHV